MFPCLHGKATMAPTHTADVLERANDVFLSYFAATPHKPRPPAKLQFAPYQVLLSDVAGPEMVRYNTEVERYTFQLFCSSTGSG